MLNAFLMHLAGIILNMARRCSRALKDEASARVELFTEMQHVFTFIFIYIKMARGWKALALIWIRIV